MGVRASVRAASSVPSAAAAPTQAHAGEPDAGRCGPGRGAGFHGDHLHGPDHRIYHRSQERITPARAQELLRAGAVMAVDECGCGGYCGLTWPAATERAELARRPPAVTKRRFGWLEEWHSDAGEPVLLQNGDVRWP
jgi:hypothetical protein